MIRLKRGQKPAKLTDIVEKSLIDEFKRTSLSVWNKDYIKEPLLAESGSKCAYCEINISEESKYMEVDHFRCKYDFPDLVVEWSNLVPSCKRCNGNKSSHNVETEGMLIHPYLDDPKQHLYLKDYRLRWKDEIGRNTVEELYLNDSARLVIVRLRIGNAIADSLEELRRKTEEFVLDDGNRRKKNKVVKGLDALLDECQPKSPFSSIAATTLLSDENYKWIRQELMRLGLWVGLAPKETIALEAAL